MGNADVTPLAALTRVEDNSVFPVGAGHGLCRERLSERIMPYHEFALHKIPDGVCDEFQDLQEKLAEFWCQIFVDFIVANRNPSLLKSTAKLSESLRFAPCSYSARRFSLKRSR